MDYSKIFKNCLKVIRTEEGYFPFRFTEKQMEVYKKVSVLSETRSFCNSGVTMEFITDRPEISFTYEMIRLYKPNAEFDVYENDVLCEIIKHPDLDDGGRVVYKRQNTEKSKITIYLPHLAQIAVDNIEIGNFSLSTDECRKFLFLGDSITQGMSAVSPSMTYTCLLARFYHAEYLNQAIAGECFHVQNLDEDLEFNPDTVFVAYGTNDVTNIGSIDEIENNINDYFDKLVEIYSNSQIYAITPLWRDFTENPLCWDKAKQVKKIIEDKARKSGFQTVEGLALVPHLSSCFSDATTHPNEIGFHQYALNLCSRIKI